MGVSECLLELFVPLKPSQWQFDQINLGSSSRNNQGSASALKWPVLFQRLHGTQELILRATDVAKLPAVTNDGISS